MNEEIIQEEEFTFKKLFDLIKASFARIVIFCIIAAIFMGAVCLTVYAVDTSDGKTVTTVISYSHEGIESGNDPNGNTLDTSIIKAQLIVSAAVSELSSSNEEIANADVTDITDNMTVEGVIPTSVAEQMAAILEVAETTPSEIYQLYELEYYCSKYSISINDINELGLSSDSATMLLNEIISQYMIYFNATYNSMEYVSVTTLDITTDDVDILSIYGVDYSDLYSLYASQISSFSSYLTSINSTTNNYRSAINGTSFTDISSALSLISSTTLSRLETYVFDNALTCDIDAIIAYYELMIENAEVALAAAQAKSDAIDALIEAYDNGENIVISTSSDSSGDVIYSSSATPTETYNYLFTQKLEYETEVATYDATITTLQSRLEKYESVADGTTDTNSDENKTSALELAVGIESSINTLITTTNELLAEYYDEQLYEAITITISAIYSASGDVSITILLAASMLVIMVAGVSAIFVTYGKQKKALELAEKKEVK